MPRWLEFVLAVSLGAAALALIAWVLDQPPAGVAGWAAGGALAGLLIALRGREGARRGITAWITWLTLPAIAAGILWRGSCRDGPLADGYFIVVAGLLIAGCIAIIVLALRNLPPREE